MPCRDSLPLCIEHGQQPLNGMINIYSDHCHHASCQRECKVLLGTIHIPFQQVVRTVDSNSFQVCRPGSRPRMDTASISHLLKAFPGPLLPGRFFSTASQGTSADGQVGRGLGCGQELCAKKR